MNRHRLIKFVTLFAFVSAISCDSLLLAAFRFGLRFSKRPRVFKIIAWTLDPRTRRPSVTHGSWNKERGNREQKSTPAVSNIKICTKTFETFPIF